MKKFTKLILLTMAFMFSSVLTYAQCGYQIELTDSYGDGWNGGMNIEVFADGMSQGTATVSWNSPVDMGESESTTICVDEGAQ